MADRAFRLPARGRGLPAGVGGRPARNAEHVLRFVDDARKQGVQVLVFPELGLTGYTCGDLFFSLTTLIGGAERALERILRRDRRATR